MLLSPVMVIGGAIDSRRRGRKGRRKEAARFTRELGELRDVLVTAQGRLDPATGAVRADAPSMAGAPAPASTPPASQAVAAVEPGAILSMDDATMNAFIAEAGGIEALSDDQVDAIIAREEANRGAP